MERYLIEGETSLNGEVDISGAKNAAVAIIPATILARGRCVIENVPFISDVGILLEILKSMGVKTKRLSIDTLEIDTTDVTCTEIPYEYARSMRASYYFLGALLGLYREAKVPMPGGCDFGVRPIDQHLKGFKSLGAEVMVDGGMIHAKADKLIGSHIHFDVVSVGATVNVMMAAVRASGITILENAAKEPHIVDLANFLNSMGADVRGAGTDVIKIHGVDVLRPSTYSIIPDQIEAGTYMIMAAATGGEVLVKNVIPKHLESITDKLMAAGVTIEEFDDALLVKGPKEIQKINLKTMPHPGFPTDLQPQMTAMLCKAKGTSIITEGVWEGGRFKYVDELKRMGADISVDGKMAVVEGVDRMTAAPIRATDLRAGAALITAALYAEGTTELDDIEYVERGYERIVEKLTALGANIQKIIVPDSEVVKPAQ